MEKNQLWKSKTSDKCLEAILKTYFNFSLIFKINETIASRNPHLVSIDKTKKV